MIHSSYSSQVPSGENSTVNEIGNLLASHDFSINMFTLSSDLLIQNKYLMLKTGLKHLGVSNFAEFEFEKFIDSSDAIQIHNSFPVLDPYRIRIILESKLPVTRVIHNYRLSCLNGSHRLRNSNCFTCKDKDDFKTGIFYGCYKGSRQKSFIVAKHTDMIASFLDQAEADYIAISSGIGDYILSLGIKKEKIHVIENHTPSLNTIAKDADEVLFVGRLEEEKGIRFIINTWNSDSNLPILNIVGTGSLDDFVRESARSNPRIRFHGSKYGGDLEFIARRCRITLAIGEWIEPFGRVISEALSRGQFVIWSKNGIAEILKQHPATNSEVRLDTKELIRSIEFSLDTDLTTQIDECRNVWRKYFSSEIAASKWLKYYGELLA
jgi:glycosyltransferase involved in cell wall biosynthesis